MEGQESFFVGVEGAGVFDDVDVFRGPAGGYVGKDDLLEKGPLRGGWISIVFSMGSEQSKAWRGRLQETSS